MVKNNNKNNNKRRNSKQNKKNNQKGGRVVMPSEYYGIESGRYFPSGSPELQIANSAYGKNYPTSRGILIADNLSGPDLGATKNSGMQTGGRVTMPSEYYGKNSGRYFQAGSPELQIANSAYGKNYPTSRGILIADNLSGPDLGATRNSGMQTGGAEFQYIVNPETGRKVSIHGKTGQKVLKNYVNNLYN